MMNLQLPSFPYVTIALTTYRSRWVYIGGEHTMGLLMRQSKCLDRAEKHGPLLEWVDI